MTWVGDTLQYLPAFLAASVVLAVTPGPGVAYIVARTLAQGRAAGMASALGVALGNGGNAAGAALGLAALFAASAAAFAVVTWAGAAYLVWLGVRLWRRGDDAARGDTAGAGPGSTRASPEHDADGHADRPDLPASSAVPARIVRDGFIVALFNPKTTLFFAAFLPQFVVPQVASPLAPSLMLGAMFVAIALASDIAYVLGAAWIAPRLAGRWAPRTGRRLSAALFIGLGLLAALAQRPGR